MLKLEMRTTAFAVASVWNIAEKIIRESGSSTGALVDMRSLHVMQRLFKLMRLTAELKSKNGWTLQKQQ